MHQCIAMEQLCLLNKYVDVEVTQEVDKENAYLGMIWKEKIGL